MSVEQKKSLLVIGGADGMANWLARRVFGRLEIGRITLLDICPPEQIPSQRFLKEISQLARPVDALQISYNNGSDNLVRAWKPIPTQATPPTQQLPLSEYDIVMLGVPEDQIPITTANLFPHLNRSSWIFDICSTKEEPIQQMLRYAPCGASVIGTHPLFGPAMPDLVGQTMVMIETPLTHPDHLKWQADLYKDLGALIVQADASEHDFHMRFTQGLTHFTYLAFGEALGRVVPEGFDPEKSFKFMTLPYAAIVGFLDRILAAGPRVYAQIQAGLGASETRELMINATRHLADQFESGSEQKIAAAISKIAEPFQGHAVARGVSYSSAFVAAYQAYFRLLYERRVCGGLTVVKTTEPIGQPKTEHYHAGVVIDYDSEALVLRERTASRNGKSVIVYDEVSERGAQRLRRRLGIVLPEPREVRIHHKRARILSDGETTAWRKDHLFHHQFDIPFMAQEASRAIELIPRIPLLYPDVLCAETRADEKAKWLNQYGFTNHLLHTVVFGDRDALEAQKQVADLLNILGLHVHREFFS